MTLESVTEKMQGTRISDMSKDELMELFGAVAQRAADNALKSVGLDDKDALDDIRNLRDILRGYRLIRKGAFIQFGRILVWIVVLLGVGLVYNSPTTKELVKHLPGPVGG